jgi:hypothetical protein
MHIERSVGLSTNVCMKMLMIGANEPKFSCPVVKAMVGVEISQDNRWGLSNEATIEVHRIVYGAEVVRCSARLDPDCKKIELRVWPDYKHRHENLWLFSPDMCWLEGIAVETEDQHT